MVRGRQSHDWGIASHLMFLMAIINNTTKQELTPDMFNPMLRKPKKTDAMKISMDQAIRLFVKGGGK